MEYEDNKIDNVKKLNFIKSQFDNSMKILEKNIAESIINKKKLNDFNATKGDGTQEVKPRKEGGKQEVKPPEEGRKQEVKPPKEDGK